MGSKRKGTRAERELFDMLWTANFSTIRSAGSGSTPRPSPDLITSNGERVLAIECKSIKKDKVYLTKKEIKELKDFCKLFKAEPWIGVRFDNLKWFFLELNKLKKTDKNYVVNLSHALKKGLKFEELIGKYRQKRII